MNKTIEAFKDDIHGSLKLREKILLNIKSKTEKEMILNQVELYFNFEKENIELIYFVLDSDYPNVIINFKELKDIINSVR
ncbi:hypothetical protein [Brachyspira hyodysenteriae]|uniref:hypothetical protein n=1 Tax=Brachyspira hyodysenteriae TaxID=159 RepID=UPI00063D8A48|nr:hypothetical protein [Brachyspira hyodysenteriae]KLI17423.1 hypothetical protein SU45_05715 [Brachyspira hyodysenteriae]KLI61943.1 hypothetical protein SZ46_04225 [Brachyspira hyodysenteriae]